ncbi:phosphoribosylglycinamide formyltransferase [Lampropedia cohaerens]|uniref:Phosphoribosylglycinamide formyltransferase n=1 Tax=Lampropedia cohaerens TaxID=1610491 RepID=A0A0U1Q180_9BURK|nr:phosphoribosylglycinamide formyltransferase [Lampropedia cohaerens]KKW68518.1 phosphoribosylglycinamide formyltransferase [Lampropedia cohaerens]
MKNIVILISGAGSNMAAIVETAQREHWQDTLGARVAAVVSNRPQASGLAWADGRGIATAVVDHQHFTRREDFDAALARAVAAYTPTLVVLAGFMRVLTPVFIGCFAGRMLNIHPSLLPAFPGLNTHQRALDAGCRFAGATVHWVTQELDSGPVVDQAIVPVLPGDDAAALRRRVQSQEHVLYPRAIRAILPTLQAP